MPLLLFAASLLFAEKDGLRRLELPDGQGAIVEQEADAGIWQIQIEGSIASRSLRLAPDLPPPVRAWRTDDPDQAPLTLEWNLADGAASVRLPAPRDPLAKSPLRIDLETAERSGQCPDGRIVFCPADAALHGETARLETGGGHWRIVSGSDAADRATWKFQATRPGVYVAEVVYSLAGDQDRRVELNLGGPSAAARLSPTGAAWRYTALSVGTLRIEKPGEHTLTATCGGDQGTAALGLLAVSLRPASEGRPVVQDDEGIVTCHARDVTIRGVQVQWEPKPEKNTVGYWTNPRDRVTWDFTLRTPGAFEVEVLQGCGQGQGGSDVQLSVGGQTLRFMVEDTGHFQNFIPRRIGRVRLDAPGRHTLEVAPRRKAGVAVMDLRQVRLLPVADERNPHDP